MSVVATQKPGGSPRLILLALLPLLVFGGLFAALSLYFWESRPVQVLDIGIKAPVFQLTDQNTHPHKLADYQGRPVILAFFGDQMPTTIQALNSLRDHIHDFDKAGAKIFGVSALPASELQTLHTRERLPFPLLHDAGGALAKKYGARESRGNVKNVTFAIDGDGFVVTAIEDVDFRNHGQQVLTRAECCLTPMALAAKQPIGKTVNDFTLPRADTGQPETLYGSRRARATVVLFLSTVCPCSQGYDARVKALTDAFLPQGVRFIGVNASADETAQKVADHAKRVGFRFPVVKDANNVIADRMKAQVTPEVFVMDAQGALRYHGRIDDHRDATQVKSHDLQNAIQALLDGREPPLTQGVAMGCAIFRATPAR